jgi:hypothetical protein
MQKAEFLKLPGINPQTLETEYWNAKARLLGTELAGKEWDRCAGLAAQRRELDRAQSAESRAAWKMAQTKPTTPAGAGALLAYVKKMMFEIGDMYWHSIALETIIAALATMTPPPPRAMNAADILVAVRAEKARRESTRWKAA